MVSTASTASADQPGLVVLSAARPAPGSARERRGLGRHRHERRHRRRRALVDVGRPLWNGTSATLKPKPTSSSPTPIGSSGAKGSGTDSGAMPCADLRQVGRAGRAVDQRDAVEEEAAGERAQQEVLQRRLARPRVPAVEAGQDVQRQREDFERQEDDQEVVADRPSRSCPRSPAGSGHSRRRDAG